MRYRWNRRFMPTSHFPGRVYPVIDFFIPWYSFPDLLHSSGREPPLKRREETPSTYFLLRLVTCFFSRARRSSWLFPWTFVALLSGRQSFSVASLRNSAVTCFRPWASGYGTILGTFFFLPCRSAGVWSIYIRVLSVRLHFFARLSPFFFGRVKPSFLALLAEKVPPGFGGFPNELPISLLLTTGPFLSRVTRSPAALS